MKLAVLCNRNKPNPKYEVAEFAKNIIKAMFFSVAYPELNPADLIWANMKNYNKKKMLTTL